MGVQTLEKVEELRTQITSDLDGIAAATEARSLERLNYRLSDAIREGSTVTGQAVGEWGTGENACALHAAVIAAQARGYIQ